MEVGAVKNQLNNEIIQLKKNMNQVKVQLIHKLTRKAKTLKVKEELPEHLKSKLQRKADAAVAEVLLIKKVNAKDLVQFAITHTGILQDYINKATVCNEKVYAKMLNHKGLSKKYNILRSIFANMPIDDLLMTRKERLKLKKEQRDKEKKKELKMENKSDKDSATNDDESDVDDNESSDNGNIENEKVTFNLDNGNICVQANVHTESDKDDKGYNGDHLDLPKIKQNRKKNNSDTTINVEDSTNINIKATSKIREKIQTLQKLDNSQEMKIKTLPKLKSQPKTMENTQSRSKSRNKLKELTVKKQVPVQAHVIDSFFVTSSGDHYLTLAEPRAPDEVKEEHYRGNRKMRRAEKFGNPIKRHIKKQEYDSLDSKYEKYDLNSRNITFDRKLNETRVKSVGINDMLEDSRFKSNIKVEKGRQEDKLEKLHPSWAAKKQKSGIAEFQGKKLVFS